MPFALHQPRDGEAAHDARMAGARPARRAEAGEVHAVRDDRVGQPRVGAHREAAEVLAARDDAVGPAPDPAGERPQHPVRPVEPRLAGVVAGDVGAAQGDDDRRVAQRHERQHRPGREREEQMHDVVVVLAHPGAHQGERGAEVAQRAAHSRLVHAGAPALHPVHREQAFLRGVPVPVHFRPLILLLAGGDDVHRHPARGEPPAKRLRGHAGAPAERRKFVVQQEDAHRARDIRSQG